MWKSSDIIQKLVNLVGKISQAKGVTVNQEFWTNLQQLFHKSMLKQGFAIVNCQLKSKYHEAKNIVD